MIRCGAECNGMLLGGSIFKRLDSIHRFADGVQLQISTKKPPKGYEKFIGQVMVSETTQESGMDYLTVMVDKFGSETALMTGWLAFGRNFFSGIIGRWNNRVLE